MFDFEVQNVDEIPQGEVEPAAEDQENNVVPCDHKASLEIGNKAFIFEVSAPLVKTDETGKYSLYTINYTADSKVYTGKLQGSVQRRFKDIKILRQMLVNEGLTSIPSLPSQHLNRMIVPHKSLYSDEFHTKRMGEIKNFLDQCDAVPILNTVFPFRDFLTKEVFVDSAN